MCSWPPSVLLCDDRLSAEHTALDAVQLMQDRLGPLNMLIFSGETIDFKRIEPLRHAQILCKPVSAEQVPVALSWRVQRPQITVQPDHARHHSSDMGRIARSADPA